MNRLVSHQISVFDCIYVTYCETYVFTINCELNVILNFLNIYVSVNAVQLPAIHMDINM